MRDILIVASFLPLVSPFHIKWTNKCVAPTGSTWLGATGSHLSPDQSVVSPLSIYTGGPLERSSRNIYLPDDFVSTRFWLKLGCDDAGQQCKSGDCGVGPTNCNGLSSSSVTLVEITLKPVNGSMMEIWYDISLVDAWSFPVSIDFPSNPTCTAISCDARLDQQCAKSGQSCPEANRKLYGDGTKGWDGEENAVVLDGACLSNCSLYDTDEACCRGEFNRPEVCLDSNPVFRQRCPAAYSYAYSDVTTLFSCLIPRTGSGMEITTCK